MIVMECQKLYIYSIYIYIYVLLLEALGARLEEMMHEDKQNVANIVSMVTEECRQKDLLIEDEEEDFLDEGLRVINVLTECIE
jgi:hypothetical protein